METNRIATNRFEKSGCLLTGALRFAAATFFTVPLLFVLTPSLLVGIAIGQTKTTITHHRTIEQDSSSELAQAETAIEKRDYPTAQQLLQKTVLEYPNNYQAWFDLGFVFHALGKTDESIAAYRKSVAANPNVFESNLNLGLTLAQSKNPEAEQFLRAATKLKPTAHVEEGQARAWLSLAHFIEAAKPGEALEAYRQAEALKPADPEPHLSAGLLLEKQNRFEDAAQEYKSALALDPSSMDAVTGLANAYMRGRQFPQAEEMLRKIATARPGDGVVHLELGRILAAEGRKDDAITELEMGLKIAPGDGAAQRDLGDLYADAGKYDKAEAVYRALAQKNPGDPELHDVLGKALLKQHKFPEAEQEFMATVRLKPDFGAAYGDLAVAANENKNYDLAIKAVDARAKFLPEIPVSYFLRATAYDHLRDRKDAILNYHKFLELANGQFPDQEWQARQRLKAIEPKR
ncbi:MAG: tetratricopeptide repeat protein [Terriglobales bacterium]